MAMSERAVPKNRNHTLPIYLPLTILFIVDACPDHILESTKWIEMKLGTHVDVNKRKYRRQEP